jgi:hypothetical protein
MIDLTGPSNPSASTLSEAQEDLAAARMWARRANAVLRTARRRLDVLRSQGLIGHQPQPDMQAQ